MVVKKNNPSRPETKGLKKILLGWWFWILVAVVSYFIFASIPITWNESGFGWDTWEGTNPYKTLFGYISLFAFLIAIILVGFSIIKYIQKSPIGDYWKISFTILGIVLIIVFSFFYIKQYIPTGDKNFELPNEEERIKEFLTEEGYEVMSVYVSNYSANAPFFEWYNIQDNTICDDSKETICYSDKVGVSVEMKSLGSRNTQIWDVLLSSNVVSPNAFVYRMTINSPTDTCDYIIFGDTYREYTKELDRCVPKSEEGYLSLNEECFDSEGNLKEEARVRNEALRNKIELEIEKYKTCS